MYVGVQVLAGICAAFTYSAMMNGETFALKPAAARARRQGGHHPAVGSVGALRAVRRALHRAADHLLLVRRHPGGGRVRAAAAAEHGRAAARRHRAALHALRRRA